MGHIMRLSELVARDVLTGPETVRAPANNSLMICVVFMAQGWMGR
jgi:hypothetical protein